MSDPSHEKKTTYIFNNKLMKKNLVANRTQKKLYSFLTPYSKIRQQTRFKNFENLPGTQISTPSAIGPTNEDMVSQL